MPALPLLSVEKKVDRSRVIVGGEVRFDIIVTNIGEAPAYRLEMRDLFKNKEFMHKIDTLAPGRSSNLTYTVQLTERGEILTGMATVRYSLRQSPAADTYTAYSTQIQDGIPGAGEASRTPFVTVLSPAEYRRTQETDSSEWILLAFMLLFPLAFPLYISTKRNRELALLDNRKHVAKAS
eukprot:CAMPEP_0201481306 /NCGR_PEP_ID=MMETSP0151_2-20130828/5577_1 /ASSEMBLY_ACC=CAM_ASM_000257 /TAXON_ID=200890 /ORGANISM="Paramoeba atlantica, Strain 621/1 / CCAP 1560/9" /LENGTH=179 /DNA_ID=CAMNT_0047863425 /DNA_START=32 /DNA_END=571 /DNA_ORIENTATION=-